MFCLDLGQHTGVVGYHTYVCAGLGRGMGSEDN